MPELCVISDSSTPNQKIHVEPPTSTRGYLVVLSLMFFYVFFSMSVLQNTFLMFLKVKNSIFCKKTLKNVIIITWIINGQFNVCGIHVESTWFYQLNFITCFFYQIRCYKTICYNFEKTSNFSF